MAAAPPTAPYNVGITVAPDDMDLHSDTDFRFGSGEGDIEIDIQPTDQHNDDLSIYDAASDAGLEVQTATADQDDFMVDNEDVIEDDIVNFDDNDVHVADAEQPATSPAKAVADDEDLIDYSDDEEGSMWTGNEVVAAAANAEADDVVKNDGPNQSPHENSVEDVASNTSAHAFQNESDAGPVGGASLEGSHVYADDSQNFDEQPEDSLEAYEDTNTYDDSPEEAKATLANDSTYPAVDAANFAQVDGTPIESNDVTNVETQLPAVTVNYDGAELWLFKMHDYENSGDYLVEDEGLATEPLSHVLEACREPLGDAISDNIELGFRLDDFHNIELFQEHTSCAFVTLAGLLNLYHQLHAQDGTSNPDSFYMTLLFRPRVSSLLNELQKAATEGIGHSGLERAIASGLTAFNAQTSHNSTEHVSEEWANGEEQQEEDNSHEEPEEQVDEVVGDTLSNRDAENVHGQEQHKDVSVEQSVQSTQPAPATPAASVPNSTPAAEDRLSVKNEVEGSQPLVTKSGSNSTHASPASHYDDDIIDYSDDEPEEEVARTDVARTTPPSSASSTIQGDVPDVQDHAEVPADDEGHLAIDEGSNGLAVDDVTASTAHYEEEDALYAGFDESYGDGENYVEESDAPVVGLAGGVTNEYPKEHPTHLDDGTTNQYENAEHETGIKHLEVPSNAPDEQSTVPALSPAPLDNTLEDGATHLDDEAAFADLWNDEGTGAYAEDEIQFDSDNEEIDEIGFDDEDGAAGQAPVAASAAANPADTLSYELFEMSPQGQKRTLDEAAIDADGAAELSDVKRPRV